ncbi:hypothetical protein LRU_01992 [Ligilactobacillus ruminis SPM0211]|uniref:Uncharacterized protein n=1 Tax=Ligilactobacillus ruminis SPM0211 TaxID=1040964 RepID=F7R2P6_9LACO|nr:hypothetical protein LRU_01992 [Ligilactobacillus ruminis SPM0211]HCI90679.1 hypothetical protein [Lactobacillus sp.]
MPQIEKQDDLPSIASLIRFFFTSKKLKRCITNSIANRPPSFGISFNSSKKLNFFCEIQCMKRQSESKILRTIFIKMDEFVR